MEGVGGESGEEVLGVGTTIMYTGRSMRCLSCRRPAPKPNRIGIGMGYSNVYKSSVPQMLRGKIRFCPVMLKRRFSKSIMRMNRNMAGIGIKSRMSNTPLGPYVGYSSYRGKGFSLYGRCDFVNSERRKSGTSCMIVPRRGTIMCSPNVPCRRTTVFRPTAMTVRKIFRGSCRNKRCITMLNNKAVKVFAVR